MSSRIMDVRDVKFTPDEWRAACDWIATHTGHAGPDEKPYDLMCLGKSVAYLLRGTGSIDTSPASCVRPLEPRI